MADEPARPVEKTDSPWRSERFANRVCPNCPASLGASARLALARNALEGLRDDENKTIRENALNQLARRSAL